MPVWAGFTRVLTVPAAATTGSYQCSQFTVLAVVSWLLAAPGLSCQPHSPREEGRCLYASVDWAYTRTHCICCCYCWQLPVDCWQLPSLTVAFASQLLAVSGPACQPHSLLRGEWVPPCQWGLGLHEAHCTCSTWLTTARAGNTSWLLAVLGFLASPTL